MPCAIASWQNCAIIGIAMCTIVSIIHSLSYFSLIGGGQVARVGIWIIVIWRKFLAIDMCCKTVDKARLSESFLLLHAVVPVAYI